MHIASCTYEVFLPSVLSSLVLVILLFPFGFDFELYLKPRLYAKNKPVKVPS